MTDERLHHLIKVFGRDAARAFWEAGIAAIDEIAAIVRQKAIDCDFKWVDGYLHGKLEEEDVKKIFESH